MKKDKLRQLVRTYPQATAGMPTKIDYDTTSGRFSMTYRPDRASGTDADLRQPAHRAEGYDVRVTAAGPRRTGHTCR